MQSWIIPCNLKYYDVFGAFKNLKKLDWKQSNPTIEVGDIVYIYVGAPIKAIVFKCLVTKVKLETIEIDDSEFSIVGEVYETYPMHMELELLEQYDKDLFNASNLAEHGLKGRVMCQRRMEESVQKFINENV